MRSLKYIKSVLTILLCAAALTTSSICIDKADAQTVDVQPAAQTVSALDADTAPLDIVNCPKNYLNKTVTMNAEFDKFSTLGLDYKPAFKSSEDYISFLIKRNDTTYDIPLSEMKLFIKRDEAEKFIDLKSGDEIQITGTVFSDALGDTWVDVSKLIIIKRAPKTDGVK